MVDSIRPQLPADYPIEVLVVDNNSTDGTARYACALATSDPAFSYYLETRQGLSHARNGGADAARYSFLLYCDDDAFLSPDFIKSMGKALAAHDPDMFGGPCLPDYVDPKPDWFPGWLEVRKKTEISGFYNNVTLSGSNFGIRRSTLKRIGGFNPEYGMTAKRPGMLEERLAIEAYRRLTPADQQTVYYSVESFVYHHTPSSRMRVWFQLRRIYQANYHYIRYCLQQGVRSPLLFAGSMVRRCGSELLRFAGTLPALWRTRRSSPDRAMSEIVRLFYRIADAHAAVEFALAGCRRVERRLKATIEDRPLEIAVLCSDKFAAFADVEVSETQFAVLRALGNVQVRSIFGQNSRQMRATIDALNPRSLDVIVTDNAKALEVCASVRAHLPHLQVLLWARERGGYELAQWPWRNARKPGETITRLLRLRRTARKADQVIWSATPKGRVARILLGPRAWVVAGPNNAEAWRDIINAARIWAPRRLSR